jgi:hypothetical protein
VRLTVLLGALRAAAKHSRGRKDRPLVQDAKERLRGSYFAGFLGLCFRSLRSLLRPKARLLAARSSKEMKCTGTPKKVLATLFPPSGSELDAGDLGQNVNADGSNPNLINDLLLGECFRSDAVTVERSTKLPERFDHPTRILR